MRYISFLLVIVTASVYYTGCSFLPVQSKPDVPSDHTNNRGGFLHTGNPRDASTCVTCHGSDLRGGVYFINGRNVVTESCYQCHSVLWKSGPGSGGAPSVKFSVKNH